MTEADARHATGEQLALLAMGADVPPEVAAHVRRCGQCTREESIVRSLLNADGPDTTNVRDDDESNDEPPPAAATAMADTAPGRDAGDPESPEPDLDPSSDTRGAEHTGRNRPGFNPLVAALVIAVGFAVVLLLLLRS